MIDVGICSECGRENVGRDTFCGGCGARMTPAPDGLEAWARQNDDVRDLLLDRLRETTIGEYEVRGVIGRGGMASVFVAYDLTLNRRVALKAMHPGFLSDSGMRERFRQEARLVARLDHPNIVTVHAVKERGGIVFFDLKLVEGTSLDRLVRFYAKPLSVELSCWATAKIAEALHYAHEQSVVHRDMKPANVMVDQRGDLIVTDFGIAKAAESPQLTMTGTVVGTPAYMSPDNSATSNVTRRRRTKSFREFPKRFRPPSCG
jgi:serine/threonine-protein kinase